MNTSTAGPDVRRLEIVGPGNAPVVVILGGISASSHVTASPENPERGWWNNFVGEGEAIDTGRYRVATLDYRFSEDAGPVSAIDQAAALSTALDEEEIFALHAVVGTSFGGTVALAFGAREPDRAQRLIVYGAAHESSPAATVCRTIQRQIVELGLRTGRALEGLALARGLALTTYSTREEYDRLFGTLSQDERVEAVTAYLTRAGERFALRMLPERFVEVSRSIDLERIDAEKITAPTTLIGVEEDLLVPPSLLRTLAELIGPNCRLEMVSSSFGHDAFLEEPETIAGIVGSALAAEVAS